MQRTVNPPSNDFGGSNPSFATIRRRSSMIEFHPSKVAVAGLSPAACSKYGEVYPLSDKQ